MHRFKPLAMITLAVTMLLASCGGQEDSVTTNVGSEHPNVDISNGAAGDGLITGLRALGHAVGTAAQSSSLSTIVVANHPRGFRYLQGGADPGREGVALGDVFPPGP